MDKMNKDLHRETIYHLVGGDGSQDYIEFSLAKFLSVLPQPRANNIPNRVRSLLRLFFKEEYKKYVIVNQSNYMPTTEHSFMVSYDTYNYDLEQVVDVLNHILMTKSPNSEWLVTRPVQNSNPPAGYNSLTSEELISNLNGLVGSGQVNGNKKILKLINQTVSFAKEKNNTSFIIKDYSYNDSIVDILNVISTITLLDLTSYEYLSESFNNSDVSHEDTLSESTSEELDLIKVDNNNDNSNVFSDFYDHQDLNSSGDNYESSDSDYDSGSSSTDYSSSNDSSHDYNDTSSSISNDF